MNGTSKWAGLSKGAVGGIVATVSAGILASAETTGFPLSADVQFGLQVAATIGGTLSTIGRSVAKAPIHWIPGRGGK